MVEDGYCLNLIMSPDVSVSIQDLDHFSVWGIVQMNLMIEARNLESKEQNNKPEEITDGR